MYLHKNFTNLVILFLYISNSIAFIGKPIKKKNNLKSIKLEKNQNYSVKFDRNQTEILEDFAHATILLI